MGDFDYDEIQSKLNPTSDEADSKEDVEIDRESDEFSMDDYDPEEDVDKEEDEEEEGDKPTPTPAPADQKPAEGVQAEPQGITTQQAEAIKAEAIKLVGEDTVLTIKGVERRLKDFSPQEIVNGLQKGVRADQIFNELSAYRRQLEEEKALVERGATMVQQYLDQAKRIQPTAATQGQFNPPAALVTVHPDDPEEVVVLKQTIAAQAQVLGTLQGQYQSESQHNQLSSLVKEVESFSRDYPMASVDEAIAIKLARPDINTEDLMRAGHDYYSSKEHLLSGFKANPEFKRAYDDEVIKNYLAQKQGGKSFSGSKSGSSSPKRVTETAKKPIRDFRGADEGAKAYLKELMRSTSQSD